MYALVVVLIAIVTIGNSYIGTACSVSLAVREWAGLDAGMREGTFFGELPSLD